MPDTIRVITLAKQGPAGPQGETGPIGPPFGVGQFATSTDPATDAAVTQAIVDASDGAVITLTAAGNAQTIAAPTDVTPGKAFAVVNDTASGANTVTVNGIVLTAGAMIDFRWDGAAYVLDTVRLVDSVNGKTGIVVIDPDDLDDAATTNKFTTAGDITKLAGIEAGATADQTGAEIKVAYEGESNTNAFTDGEQTKLSGIEPGAEVNPTDAEIKTAYENNSDTNAFTDADESKLDGITAGAEPNTVDSVNSQTGAVVLDADDISDAATTNKYTTASDISKLAGIEAGATADQTGAEIKVAYEAETNTNAFTDAEQSKLAGIESGATADQTDGEIKTAYENNADTNAFTDAEQTKLASLGVTYVATATSLTTTGQNVIGVTDTSAARTITISTADITNAPTIGRPIIIKDESGAAGTFNILVDTEGSETIDGISGVSITVNYGALKIYSNGTNLFTF